MGACQPIETAPTGQQILVWESDYGWLLAHKDHRYGWQLKSSGNFYGEMPKSVQANLKFWAKLPSPQQQEMK